MQERTPLGITNWRNSNQLFYIKDADRLGHIYAIGKTGTGKSTLLLNMAIADINAGKGIGIIDPHGDLSDTILNYIPKHRIEDVIYVNTSDINYPIAFNPLHNVPPTQRHLVASTIVATLKNIWKDSWGPRLEHILRNSILTLTYYPHATLLDIHPLLVDQSFRSTVLEHVQDTALYSFWHKEFNTLPPPTRAEVVSPIVNKIGLFTTHPHLKAILRQETSSITINDIMNTKKIFIANLSKGTLGEDATALLGSMLVTQFQMAALGRNTQPIHTRTPFYLYIDEMHSFVTLSFASILAEARKYGLSLFLTHQYIDQVQEDIRSAILGNVGTMISFRIGATDAALLTKEFNEKFTIGDFTNLPQYAIYLKLLIDGKTSEPFSAYTLPLTAPMHYHKESIIEYSRNTYGRKKELIEEELQHRYEGHAVTEEQRLF